MESLLEYLSKDSIKLTSKGTVMMKQNSPRYGTMYIMYLDVPSAKTVVKNLEHIRYHDGNINGVRDIGKVISSKLFDITSKSSSPYKYVRVMLIGEFDWFIKTATTEELIKDRNDSDSYDIEVVERMKWDDFVDYTGDNRTLKNPIHV